MLDIITFSSIYYLVFEIYFLKVCIKLTNLKVKSILHTKIRDKGKDAAIGANNGANTWYWWDFFQV